METVLFIITAVVAVISALSVITRRNAVASILFLVLTFFCIAVLYVLLGAGFIAAMQVIVYAGAIMVLFVFVVMMLNLSGGQKWDVSTPLRMWLGFGAAAGVLLVVAFALKHSLGPGAPLKPEMGTVAAIGNVLFRDYLLPFEAASVLLLVAIVGVVALVKRHGAGEPTNPGGAQK